MAKIRKIVNVQATVFDEVLHKIDLLADALAVQAEPTATAEEGDALRLYAASLAAQGPADLRAFATLPKLGFDPERAISAARALNKLATSLAAHCRADQLTRVHLTPGDDEATL